MIKRTCIFFCTPILLAWIWVAVNGYQGLNGQDTHDFLRIAKAWTEYAAGGDRPLVDEHTHGYPMLGAMLGGAIGMELLALRLISMCSLLLLIHVIRCILVKQHGHGSYLKIYLMLALGLSPFLLRLSMTVMSDAPSFVAVLLAFALVLGWLKKKKVRLLLGALLVMAMAIWLRLASALVVVILLGILVHGGSEGRRRRWGVALALLMLSVAVAMFMLPFVEWKTMIGNSSIMAHWSLGNMFRTELHSDDGVLRYAVPNLIFVLKVFWHPGFLLVGALTLPFFRKQDLGSTTQRIALIILISYLLFLSIMPFQNDRILLMALPFVVVLLYPAFCRGIAFAERNNIRRAWVFGALVVAQFGLFIRAVQPFIRSASLERELAEKVNELAPERIYTHGMGAAFGTYCPDTEITELWYKDLEHFDRNSVIVVHPQNLQEQWGGHSPMNNWRRANAQGVRIETETESGWVIGKVQ